MVANNKTKNILLLLISIALGIALVYKLVELRRQIPEPVSTFKGPSGPPYIKGPTGPPPTK